MQVKLIYNNKAFSIIDEIVVREDTTDVTFNDIKINFTDCNITDFPLKYQEIAIKQCEDDEDILTQGKVLFYGYVDGVRVSRNMQYKDNEPREIEITLLSPFRMSMVRTTTLNGTFEVYEAINRACGALLNDGYKLGVRGVPNGWIHLNYNFESIYNVMNYICYKRNLFWYITRNKEIIVTSIDTLFAQNPVKSLFKQNGVLYDSSNNQKIELNKTLNSIQPEIQNTDYANCLNLTNVNLIYNSISTGTNATDYKMLPNVGAGTGYIVNKGDVIQLDYPFVCSENYAKKLKEQGYQYSNVLTFQWNNTEDGNGQATITSNANSQFTYLVTNGAFSFSNEDRSTKIVLQRDNFFNTMITALKWNGADNTEIRFISSNYALVPINYRYLNGLEIASMKDKVSKSGIIEKTIDMQGKWLTQNDLESYARNQLTQNTNVVNKVVLTFDTPQTMIVGDLVSIELDDFLTSGKFAVTSLTQTLRSEGEQIWRYELRDASLWANFISLFGDEQGEERDAEVVPMVSTLFVRENIIESRILFPERIIPR